MSTLITTTVQGVQNIKYDASTTAMTINSGGVISEPNRPCFNVIKGTNQTINDTSMTQITFDESTDGAHGGRVINKGGLFSSSNNRFTVTATTTGIYLFYVNILWLATDVAEDHYMAFRKNGTQMGLIYCNSHYANNPDYGVLTGNFMLNLDSSGDYCDIAFHGNVANGGTTQLNSGGTGTNNRSIFGGYKIA